MINVPSASYSTSCLKHVLPLASRTSYLPGSPLPHWLLFLTHLFGSSSAPQLLTEGGPRAKSLVLLFSMYIHSLDDLNQSQGLKYHLYADNPRFVSPAQTSPPNSSLIHPTINSTLFGRLWAYHTLHVPSWGLLTGVPTGQSHKAPECGFMLLV